MTVLETVVKALVARISVTREPPSHVAFEEYPRLKADLTEANRTTLIIEALANRASDLIHKHRNGGSEAWEPSTVAVEDLGDAEPVGPRELLVEISYTIAGMQKALIYFTADNWRDWGATMQAQRDAYAGRADLAVFAEDLLATHKAKTAADLPDAVRETLEAEARKVPGWK